MPTDHGCQLVRLLKCFQTNVLSFLRLIYPGLKNPSITPLHAQHDGGVVKGPACGHQVLS